MEDQLTIYNLSGFQPSHIKNAMMLIEVNQSQILCSVLDILVLVARMLAKEIQVVHWFVTLMAKLSLLE